MVDWVGNHLNNNKSGTNGNDLLDGAYGSDTLKGLDGNDTLYGDRIGSHVPDSSPGADKLYGGRGNDQIFGYNGHDTLKGGRDKDILSGDEGNDAYYGGSHADMFLFIHDDSREEGNEHLGFDTIYDYEAKDELYFSDTNVGVHQIGNDVLVASTYALVVVKDADKSDVWNSVIEGADWGDF